ncbi:MAG: PEP-CTERM sorting domain-containing protein [Phycisphaerae bacterium]
MRAIAKTVAVVAAMLTSGSALAVDVTVDPGQTWLGFMNVFELPSNGGGYVFGSPWGTSDLAAGFSGNVLRLSPNTNTYNPGDGFWVQPGGAGNKFMSANMYVENTGLLGQTVNFSGQTVLNSFNSSYTSRAFVKILDANNGFSTVFESYAPLVGGQSFTLSMNVPNTPGYIPQYGFVTEGANANPALAPGYGMALIAPIPEPTSLALLALGSLFIARRR